MHFSVSAKLRLFSREDDDFLCAVSEPLALIHVGNREDIYFADQLTTVYLNSNWKTLNTEKELLRVECYSVSLTVESVSRFTLPTRRCLLLIQPEEKTSS
jgi:hypothetical protein